MKHVGNNEVHLSACEEEGSPLTCPLYVDLDGTLTPCDTAQEQLVDCILHGKGHLSLLRAALTVNVSRIKQVASTRADFQADLLPYNVEVLNYINAARNAGRRVVLATAADRATALAVAGYLGIFDDVLASENGQNLKSEKKLAAIQSDSNGEAFEYIGDSRADLAIWKEAEFSGIVASQNKTREFAAQAGNKVSLLVKNDSANMADYLRAMRPHQWVKNLLVFLPMLFAHTYTDADALTYSCIAFVAFSLLASGVYIVNDLSDLDADRMHSRKRNRPFAAGKIEPIYGLTLAAMSIIVSLSVSYFWVNKWFAAFLIFYLALTTLYSLYLKQYSTVDVLTLAMLYTLRIGAGAVATGISISPWLLTFSFFFFVSLAYMKRFVELQDIEVKGEKLPSRNYWGGESRLMIGFGIANASLCLLTLAQFIGSDHVSNTYGAPDLLWLTIPLLMFWLNRSWLYAARGKVGDDPVYFAVRDRISRRTLSLIVATILFARYLDIESVLI